MGQRAARDKFWNSQPDDGRDHNARCMMHRTMAATLIPCPVDRAECSPRSFDVGMQTAPRTMAKHSELNTDLAWHASGWLERSIVAWILPLWSANTQSCRSGLE